MADLQSHTQVEVSVPQETTQHGDDALNKAKNYYQEQMQTIKKKRQAQSIAKVKRNLAILAVVLLVSSVLVLGGTPLYLIIMRLRETWWLWVVWIIYAILGTIVLIQLLDHIKLVRNYKREQKEKQDPTSIDLDSINFEELFAEEDEEKK